MKNTKNFLKISIFAITSLFPFSSNAVITYGESNLSSEVDYQNPENSALTSVVAVSDSSAVHLGNGWFLTANHVSVNSSISVSQNGETAKVSYVDNTLNSSYGADLKLFYVEDYQSLTSLSSVGIASQNAYASLETTTFGYSRTGNIITGYTYDLTYERGTLITIAGAGFAETTLPQSTRKPFLQTVCTELSMQANHRCSRHNQPTALITLLLWRKVSQVRRRP